VKMNFLGVLALAVAGLSSASAYASLTLVNHRSQFLQNVGTPTVDIDFESFGAINFTPGQVLASGSTLFGKYQGSSSVVAQIGELTYAIPGCSYGDCRAMVANDYASTSGTQYLGLNDASNYNLFIGGMDSIRIGFLSSNGVSAFGMYLIASDGVDFGALMLEVTTVAGTSSFIYGGTVDRTLSDGGLAYFLGVSGAESAITSVDLRFNNAAAGTFLYGIDDILVEQSLPEPGALALFAIALSGLVLAGRGRARVSR
jgi:hypothetical protein